MIEDAQETENIYAESSALAPKRVLPRLRARRLSAIEIAEGALLADIGVVFQLLIKYLPVGGAFLALLIQVAFSGNVAGSVVATTSRQGESGP